MMRFAVVQAVISEYIQENFDRLEVGAELEGWRDIHTLANSVDRLVVAESCKPKSHRSLPSYVAWPTDLQP